MTQSGDERRRSLGTQAIALAVGTALAQLVVAVLYLVAARGSTLDDFGRTVAAIALGSSAIGFFDFGTNSFWVRERAAGRLDTGALSERAQAKLLLAFVLAVFVALASIGLGVMWLISAGIFFAGSLAQVLLVPLRASRRGEIVGMLTITERLGALTVFGVLMVIGLPTLTSLAIALICGTLTMSVVAFLAAHSEDRFRFGRPRVINPWKGTRHYGFASLAASGQQLDLPVLTWVGGAAVAGVYGAVNRWTQPMGLLANAFSTASTPFLARAADWKSTRQLVSRASWLLLFAIGVCVALAIAAPWLTPTLLGDKFASSAPVLQLLALGTIPAILNQPLSTALQARRHDDLVARVYLSCVLLQLALVAWLGGAFGAVGAAVAFLFLQVIMLASLSVCVAIAIARDKRNGASEP